MEGECTAAEVDIVGVPAVGARAVGVRVITAVTAALAAVLVAVLVAALADPATPTAVVPDVTTAAAPGAPADPPMDSLTAPGTAPTAPVPPSPTPSTTAPTTAPSGPPPSAPAGAGVAAPGAGYAWPLLSAPVVRTPFRAPAHRFGPGHRGVDLVGGPGQAVLAARGGTVVFAGAVAGRPLVSVQHDDGLRTTYEPVTPAVTAGSVVAAGAVLGTLEPGHPGCPDPACLHWGARRDRTDHLDPLILLRPPRVRLLPVPDPWPG